MMRHLWKVIGLCLVAACGAPSLPEGEVEPIRKVLADNRALPYECVGYDAGTDTCVLLVTRRLSGDTIRYAGVGLVELPELGPTRMQLKLDARIEGERYCSDMRNVDLRFEAEMSPSVRSLYEEVVLAELIRMGVVCGVYYRDGGGYLSVSTNAAGKVLPDGVDHVRFFRQPKRLRL